MVDVYSARYSGFPSRRVGSTCPVDCTMTLASFRCDAERCYHRGIGFPKLSYLRTVIGSIPSLKRGQNLFEALTIALNASAESAMPLACVESGEPTILVFLSRSERWHSVMDFSSLVHVVLYTFIVNEHSFISGVFHNLLYSFGRGGEI